MVTEEDAGTSSSRTVEKGYENRAWIILLIVAIIGLVDSFVLAAVVPVYGPDPSALLSQAGTTWTELVTKSPGVTDFISGVFKGWGISEFAWAFLGAAMTVFSYRKGERWAWYALWVTPAALMAYAVNNLSVGGSTWIGSLLGAAAFVAGLILPYRKFFPRKSTSITQRGS